jgi:hypothetical protein
MQKMNIQEKKKKKKTQQNHAMAQQILRQAINIIDKFNSLKSLATKNSFLMANNQSGNNKGAAQMAVEEVGQLISRYEELKVAVQKGDSQTLGDVDLFVKNNQHMLQV